VPHLALRFSVSLIKSTSPKIKYILINLTTKICASSHLGTPSNTLRCVHYDPSFLARLHSKHADKKLENKPPSFYPEYVIGWFGEKFVYRNKQNLRLDRRNTDAYWNYTIHQFLWHHRSCGSNTGYDCTI
jgi:hypothetical protein